MKSYGKLLSIVLLLACAMANAQTYTVLYTLGGHVNDPLNPSAIGLISQGRDGNMYTTSQYGGAHASGAAYMFTPAGSLTRLLDFSPYANPTAPWSGLTMATSGNFYGTTSSGGSKGNGTVFMLTPTGNVTYLWNFTGGTDEGIPEAAPVLGLDGNLYGTSDGVYSGTYGTAYKVTQAGNFSTIHVFKYTDGATPYQLILGLDGNFYGVTRGGGGTADKGVVFRMTKAGAVKVLHVFTGYPSDGALPVGTLAQASNGTLYGTTYQGGSGNTGTVFKISPTGTGYAVLYNFDRVAHLNDGTQPLAAVTVGTDGNLYGNTSAGGTKNAGILFKLTPAGAFTNLYNACAVTCTDGFGPQVPLVQNTDGKFYGQMRGNSLGGGAVFSLDVGLGPFVSLVLWSGKVGQTIQVLGQGFNGATAVKVGGTAASFSIASDNYLTAIVPAGTSGPVTVTVSGKTLTSNQQYLVVPTVTGFSPAAGPPGSSVVITGKGLIQTNKVTFGTKTATFTVNSDSQVTAIVPATAVTSKITLTTPGGKATSAAAFTVN